MADTLELRGSYGRRRGLNSEPSPLEPPAPGLIPAPTVCRRADITYRQLDWWCIKQYVPIAVEATGSGSNRWFHATDIPKFHVLGQLGQLGLGPNRVVPLGHQRRLRLCGVMRKLYRQAGENA